MIRPIAITSSKYDFDCEINPLELTDAQIEELGFDVGDPLTYELNLKASGTFTVEWDDDCAMVQVDSLVVEGNIIPNKVIITAVGDVPARRFLDLDLNHVEVEYIGERIEKYGDHAYWDEDRLSSAIDAACDYFEDR